MKKLFLILLLCIAGCKENSRPEVQETSPDTTKTKGLPELPEKAIHCYLSLSDEFQAGDRILRDSTVMKLVLTKEEVTGSLDWVPAEKDSRRGHIIANEEQGKLRGDYIFMQEGIQDTLAVEIEFQEAAARVVLLSDTGERMELLVDRVDCE